MSETYLSIRVNNPNLSLAALPLALASSNSKVNSITNMAYQINIKPKMPASRRGLANTNPMHAVFFE